MAYQKFEDPTPPLPFRQIEKMMPLYPALVLMGFLLLLISFFIGLMVLAPANLAFFAEAKEIRESAAVGSSFVNANVTRHVFETWVPQFKFFGLGLMLMGITMALGTIAGKLRLMGKVIASKIPAEQRPPTPAIPGRVRLFQLAALLGIMILLAVLIIGLVLAAGIVPAYWNHAIAGQLNPAAPGSVLLNQAGSVFSFPFWLNPLRLAGMAFLFTGITIALTVIIGTLNMQAKMLAEFARRAIKPAP